MIQEPVGMAWMETDAFTVVEMNTYMKDAAATGEFEPLSRIKLLEDTDNDGKMDKSTVFIDSLILPRVVLPVGDELLVTITNQRHIWSYKDVNGDGRRTRKELYLRMMIPMLEISNIRTADCYGTSITGFIPAATICVTNTAMVYSLPIL